MSSTYAIETGIGVGTKSRGLSGAISLALVLTLAAASCFWEPSDSGSSGARAVTTRELQPSRTGADGAERGAPAARAVASEDADGTVAPSPPAPAAASADRPSYGSGDTRS